MCSYLPVLILTTIAIAIPIIVWSLSSCLRPHSPSISKNTNYECGLKTTINDKECISIRYYLIAVIFLVFDVETVFLMPWAIQAKELSIFGIAEISIFIFLLLFGYGYIWSKGAFEWE